MLLPQILFGKVLGYLPLGSALALPSPQVAMSTVFEELCKL
jgi:hypothetical protein